jgi:hypothetical protein
MTAMIAVLGLVYGVSVAVVGGAALLSRHSPRLRETLIGSDVPAV